MGDSSIEWTEKTWNPLAGCTPVSEGCRNCYAARLAIRMGKNPNDKMRAKYEGTSEMRGVGAKRHAVFTGKVNLIPDDLALPLSWRKPVRVFVNSMSDLFHEAVPDWFIDEAFAVMALCPQHTFQILTKRPERMAAYMAGRDWADAANHVTDKHVRRLDEPLYNMGEIVPPLPNVWLGTSVEHQAAADERIPHLLRTPAAVRWLSCEPLLGPLDLRPFITTLEGVLCCPVCAFRTNRFSLCPNDGAALVRDISVDWVVVGGESGPGSRRFDLAWARDLIAQCSNAGVPCFVKQVGAMPDDDDQWDDPDGTNASRTGLPARLRDRKGGDMAEWPEDLRVREYPRVRA